MLLIHIVQNFRRYLVISVHKTFQFSQFLLKFQDFHSIFELYIFQLGMRSRKFKESFILFHNTKFLLNYFSLNLHIISFKTWLMWINIPPTFSWAISTCRVFFFLFYHVVICFMFVFLLLLLLYYVSLIQWFFIFHQLNNTLILNISCPFYN